jgi:hypothetical protein
VKDRRFGLAEGVEDNAHWWKIILKAIRYQLIQARRAVKREVRFSYYWLSKIELTRHADGRWH